jgi:hypothetical protein
LSFTERCMINNSVQNSMCYFCNEEHVVVNAQLIRVFVLAANSSDYDCDCMAFALLTHGDDHEMIYGTDGPMSITKLLAPLKSSDNMRNFVGKPKLVFIQVSLTIATFTCCLICQWKSKILRGVTRRGYTVGDAGDASPPASPKKFLRPLNYGCCTQSATLVKIYYVYALAGHMNDKFGQMTKSAILQSSLLASKKLKLNLSDRYLTFTDQYLVVSRKCYTKS